MSRSTLSISDSTSITLNTTRTALFSTSAASSWDNMWASVTFPFPRDPIPMSSDRGTAREGDPQNHIPFLQGESIPQIFHIPSQIRGKRERKRWRERSKNWYLFSLTGSLRKTWSIVIWSQLWHFSWRLTDSAISTSRPSPATTTACISTSAPPRSPDVMWSSCDLVW